MTPLRTTNTDKIVWFGVGTSPLRISGGLQFVFEPPPAVVNGVTTQPFRWARKNAQCAVCRLTWTLYGQLSTYGATECRLDGVVGANLIDVGGFVSGNIASKPARTVSSVVSPAVSNSWVP
jgi:hypothetical protein